ncbi:MAG: NlpC/P60 family protein [Schaedlerella sp.]|nr:NlpC/P60 family protein [Schaedlerella sp.]
MKFKRLCSFLLALAMTCSLITTPVYATPAEDKQKALEEQEKLENQKEEVSSEVSGLQEQLSALLTKISDLQLQLMQKGQEIMQAEADLQIAEQKRQQQYDDMKLRIKFMYESGDSSAVERIFGSGTISEMLAQAEYVQQVHEYDRIQLQEYVNTVEEVKVLKATLEEEEKALKALEVEYQAESDSLNAVITEKSKEIENLDALIQEAAQKVAEATAREEAERLAAIEAAAQQAAQQQQAQQQQQQQQQQQTPSGGSTSNNNTGGGATSSAPSYSASTGNAIVDRAYSCLGAAYVWGGCSPGAFDCSGLVSYCLTGSYTRLGTTVTFCGWPRVSNPQPGDVCVNFSHTGIYIGNGQMIHAATFGVGVIIGPVQSGMIYVRRP